MQMIDFQDKIGASRRDIENWQARIPGMGGFTTTFEPTRRGVPRDYSEVNVIELAFLAALVRVGCDLSKARAFSGSLIRQHKSGSLREWLIIPAPDFASATGTADIYATDFAAVANQSDCSAVTVIHAGGIVAKVSDMFAAQSEAAKA